MKLTWTDYPEYYDDKMDSISLEIPAPPLKNHIFIEGDNYPVLKKLSPLYSQKINLIYIDPPYNTGNSFTYSDKFYSGSSISTDTDKHSAWLSFMNKRLLLAKELLSQEGCIFIAIDQSELYVLKILCDQIFGEENFINDFMWLHGKGKKDTWSRTLQQHTLCYAKDKNHLKPFVETQTTNWAKSNPDNDPRGNWFSGSISFTEKRSNPNHKNFFTITSPSGIKWERQWLCSKEEMSQFINDNKIFWGTAPLFNKVPRIKIFNNEQKEIIPKNIIDCTDSTREAQNHLDKLLGEKGVFDNPKPVQLIEHLIQITQMPSDSIIMDFFAGSGTTFEAVCLLNQKDNSHRKCILIQKEEITSERKGSKKAFNAGFSTISQICMARLQKNSEQYNERIDFFKLEEKNN